MPNSSADTRRWFRRLTALLPFDTRREHAREMEAAFLSDHNETPPPARRRLWRDTIGGILTFASAEHFAVLKSDLVHAVRVWKRSPGLLALIVTSMAAGVASVIVAFAVIDAVLLRPLAVPDPERAIRMSEVHANAPTPTNVTYATFLDLSRASNTFEHVAAARFWYANLTGDGAPVRLTGALVSGEFFQALRAPAASGRLLSVDDDHAGSGVIVISTRLWRTQFAGDPAIVGRRIQINNQSVEIVGVVEAGAEFPLGADIWAPLVAKGPLATNRRSHLLQVIARVSPHVSLDAVNDELSGAAKTIAESFPGADPDMNISAEPVLDRVVAPVKRTLWTVLIAAAALLVVLTVNVAQVQLARAALRERELTLRFALGAGRGRVARLLLTESVALAGIAGVIGCAAAAIALRALPGVLPAVLPRAQTIAFNARVAVLGFAVALIAGVLMGTWPAARAMREDKLRGWRSFRGASTPARILASAQIGMTFAMIVAAVLLIRSHAAANGVPLGFSPDGVVRVDMSLPPGRVSNASDGESYAAVFDPMLARVRAIPGVVAAGLTTTAPFSGGASTGFTVAGKPVQNGHPPVADIRIVDAGFFEALSVRVVAGRTFTAADRASSAPVVVISETLARQQFPGESPVGKSITMLDWGPPKTAMVAGVVADIAAANIESDALPTIYWHYPQFPQMFTVTMFAKANGSDASLLNALPRAIWGLEPNMPLPRVESLSASFRLATAQRRVLTSLLAGFAGAAVLFALVGLYGMLAHKAMRERPANSVRVALGARPLHIASIVGREAGTLAAGGVVIGIVLAIASAQLIKALLFHTEPFDVTAYVWATVLVAIAVGAAAFGPAREAARSDPLAVLRGE